MNLEQLKELISSTKTCLARVISNTDFAILNFVSKDLLRRVEEAGSMTELYHIIIELNGISSKLPSLIEKEGSCKNGGLGSFYLPNLELILTTDLTPEGGKVGDLDSLTLEHKDTVVAAINEILNKIDVLDSIALEGRVDALETDKADRSELDNKADISEMTLLLSDKANEADVSVQLDTKADKSDLANKADTSYVNTILDEKADKVALSDKADTSYVNGLLDGKADKTALSDKADTSYVNSMLDEKADKIALDDKADISSIPRFSISLGLCANTAAIRSLTVIKTQETTDDGEGGTITNDVYTTENVLSSTAAALGEDLANIFAMSSEILTNDMVSVASVCLPRLQCVIVPGAHSFCPPSGTTNEITTVEVLRSSTACHDSTVSDSCDKTWFCNLNSLTLTFVGDNDGNMFSEIVAQEICGEFNSDSMAV